MIALGGRDLGRGEVRRDARGERALKVGSVDRIITARELRPYLVDAVERRIAGDRPR